MSSRAEHGTMAAVRAHYRRGEKPLGSYCQSCAAACRRRWAERKGNPATAGVQSPDHREIRNGLPFTPYRYRGTGRDVFEDVAS
jgi:hypothetical protein